MTTISIILLVLFFVAGIFAEIFEAYLFFKEKSYFLGAILLFLALITTLVVIKIIFY